MRKRICLALIALFTLSICGAQDRYTEPFFDEIEVETLTYATKDGEDLELDIYLPQADAEDKRATIIVMHGGGFAGGNRNDIKLVKFCSKMANYGYVVASISYRLTRKDKASAFGCDCPANEKLNTFYAAVEDVQDATFFLIENRHQFFIDPQKIILAGSSAGAESVLNTAYQPPYCYGLESGPVSFAGVISLSGAIPDTTALYEESAVPSLLFHGTEDKLVPYASAPHRLCDEEAPGYLILHGSYTIANKLKKLETPYWLHTTCGAGHEMHSSPLVDYFDSIIDFCYTYVIQQNGDNRHTVIEAPETSTNTNLYNFCSE